MSTSPSDSIALTPKSFNEAWGWALVVENYTYRMALKKAPLTIPFSAVKSCRKANFLNSDIYILEFDLKFQNQLFLKVAPTHESLSIEDVGSLTRMQMLKMLELGQPVKKFYRHLVTSTYLLFLVGFVIFAHMVRSWLLGQMPHFQWFVQAGCDLDCATKVLKLHYTFWLVTFVIVSPTIWAIAFYLINRNFMRKYRHFTALRSEAWVLGLAGCVMIGLFLNSDMTSRYRSVVSNFGQAKVEKRLPAAVDVKSQSSMSLQSTAQSAVDK